LDVIEMLREDRLLLICADPNMAARDLPKGRAAELARAGVDWRLFFKKAFLNGIFAQAYENAGSALEEGAAAPQPGYDAMKPLYLEAMVKNMKMRQEGGKAVRALLEHGILFTPMKGYLLKGLYYPQQVTREFDDIDLLLPDGREAGRARTVLASEGYSLFPGGVDAYHFKMVKRSRGLETAIELHRRTGATTFYSYPLMGDLWRSLPKARVAGAEMGALGPEHALLVACTNALRDGSLRLKDLADLLALTEPATGFRWGEVKKHAEKVGWSYALSVPLNALASYRAASGEGMPDTAGGGWLEYPIPYAKACGLLGCGRRYGSTLFAVSSETLDLQKQTAGQAFRSFRRMLSLQGELLFTHVAPDYGWRHALGCAGEMAAHTLNLAGFEVRQRLPMAKRG
jgi:hypothetical protein